ncbi:hypothetical protein F5Y16DRAFT_211513 [Xylariaceae sp. FL0255]|nr:hypothetical protein F5Y16DRAFT_211513 [Xylariaceae sp. FL0255]
MSTTMTMTLQPKSAIMSMPPTTSTSNTTSLEPSCPNCGTSFSFSALDDPHKALLQAQRQIEDLQAQVRLLNEKATAAVDRWADYEDELSRLHAASTSTNTTNNTNLSKTTDTSTASGYANNGNNGPGPARPHTPAPSAAASTPRTSFLGAGAASRISQLLSPRRSNSTPTSNPNSNPGTPSQDNQNQRESLNSTTDLQDQLHREQKLRLAAEEQLKATSREVEDLSAELFEQANAMVADERRARAALEQRVAVLEARDQEKKERIGRLEGAVRRIEIVRGLLVREDGDGAGNGGEGEKERRGEEDTKGEGEDGET